MKKKVKNNVALLHSPRLELVTSNNLDLQVTTWVKTQKCLYASKNNLKDRDYLQKVTNYMYYFIILLNSV